MAELFADGFESGDFSGWTYDGAGSTMVVNGTAAMEGSYGVEVDGAGFGFDEIREDISSAISPIRVGFRFDLNDFSLPSGETTQDLVLLTSVDDFFVVDVLNDAGTHKMRFRMYDDAASTHDVTWTITAGSKTVEVKLARATDATSNDGSMEVFIDSSSEGSATGVDNYTAFTNNDELWVADGKSTDSGTGSLYLDDFSLTDQDTEIFPITFRFLGMDADDGTLMVSGLKDEATLQLNDYDLSTLTENGTATFGSATDTELDNRTRGIFPVSKPMESDIWYLRGRDGNDVQVQYNDRNGTLGWTDIGPGTATWGTTKYAVALLPEPTRSDDVIVAFDDDDVYRTRYGTMTWVKMGDAGSGLRAAARHVADRWNEILVAGTAAGTLEWSNNFGVSFGDVSGTALGTINAIEVSR